METKYEFITGTEGDVALALSEMAKTHILIVFNPIVMHSDNGDYIAVLVQITGKY